MPDNPVTHYVGRIHVHLSQSVDLKVLFDFGVYFDLACCEMLDNGSIGGVV